ncbi:uncharacterized protein CC84DRAFT_557488 [Paraphaeosphaeria sporulosa]|uniref:Uncharacterized protein n=1 Tax=Paraphaeosphaeria sporulosa TaxID=1460663 RepID=A0A177CMP0_9PLEO|nr:uncharacterized protein CC84DRAFT_557488 [Paraphaeosphaeria sporulosa]OAG08148.1 hypothetical protein CC84DRAFT_557488 [Paraphaeosphaeria sporulosa]
MQLYRLLSRPMLSSSCVRLGSGPRHVLQLRRFRLHSRYLAHLSWETPTAAPIRFVQHPCRICPFSGAQPYHALPATFPVTASSCSLICS